MSIPRPPTPPIEPQRGDFERIRRAALVRKLRLPVAGCVALSVLAVAGFALAGGSSTGKTRLTVAAKPSETASPSPEPSTTSATATTAPTATPTPTQTRSTTRPVTPVLSTDAPPPSAQPSWTPTPLPICGIGNVAQGPDITGTVVNKAGEPLEGVTVATMWAQCVSAQTDAQGHFRISCFGNAYFVAPYPWSNLPDSGEPYGYAWLDDVPPTFEVPMPTSGGVRCGTDHRVVLPAAATVYVTVVDSNGKPFPNHVSAGQNSPERMAEIGHDCPVVIIGCLGLGSRLVDDAGEGTFGGLPPGDYWITTDAGYSDTSTYLHFTLAEGETKHITYVVPASTPVSPQPTPTGP